MILKEVISVKIVRKTRKNSWVILLMRHFKIDWGLQKMALILDSGKKIYLRYLQEDFVLLDL